MSTGVRAEPDGYDAALTGMAVAARTDRGLVRVGGRDPSGMLQGVLTNRVPTVARELGAGLARGAALYSAVLTPKGRMVAELRAIRGPRPPEEGSEEALVLDVPAAATPGLLAHLARYLPPRLARASDATAETGHLTVAGPAAAAWLARDALGLRVETSDLEGLAEDEWIRVDAGRTGVLVLRSGDLDAIGYELIADRAAADALERHARAAGAAMLSAEALEALRVEAGRPAWGRELDEETLLPEAGIDARAVDHTKGCYTGQEVIVRIRDRGHVNRRLRGLILADGAAAERGAELRAAGKERPVGALTSVVRSPRAGRSLGLGYVRREVEPRAVLRVGSVEGPEARVVELREGWWRG